MDGAKTSKHKYAECLLPAPDLFHLLCRLSDVNNTRPGASRAQFLVPRAGMATRYRYDVRASLTAPGSHGPNSSSAS